MEIICDYSVLPGIVLRLIWNKINDYRRQTSEKIVISLKDGQLSGIKRKTIYDKYYFAFEDIPYGRPPVGELRFRAPQPVEPWSGVRDCTNGKMKPMQIQPVTGLIVGSEDCLYLNVYAKQLHTVTPLPVLVWLPGGGFVIGEATRVLYSPDYFMEHDVVVVTVNYRLGAFGFLSMKDPTINIPGNAGLKDQLLALKWIKENISKFNGDQNNITVVGQSAGGDSADLLMCCEQSKNLFQKVVFMSGTALCTFGLFPKSDWSYRLASAMGYKGEKNDKQIIEFLMKVDGKEIARHSNSLYTEKEKQEFNLMIFGPIIEPYDNGDALIRKPVTELLKTAWGNKIPIIVGANSFEGLLASQMTKKYPMWIDNIGNCEKMLPYDFRAKYSAAELKKMGAKIKHAYFGDMQPSYKQHFHEFLDLMSYYIALNGVYRTTQARRLYAAEVPTYLYRFDFDSPVHNHSRLLNCGPRVRGVCHGDDLSYLFFNRMSFVPPLQSKEYKTISSLIAMLTAFAATSNPNCPEIAPTIWRPLKQLHDDSMECLNISEQIEMIPMPERHKCKIWSEIFTIDAAF